MSKKIKLKKIKPMFTSIVTTMDTYEAAAANEIVTDKTKEGAIKELQRVIAVGTSVRDIKEGDLVFLDFTRYAVKQHKDGSLKDGVIQDNPVVSYNFNTIVLNDQECLYLQYNDVVFVVEDSEEIDDKEIIAPSKTIIS